MSTVIEGVHRKLGNTSDTLLPLAVEESGKLKVSTSNIKTKFREAFEDYAPNTPNSNWIENKASGDILTVDGNAVAASYLVVSKSPWNAGTLSTLETRARFEIPFDCSIGLHTSQRVLGQEFAIDLVDDTVLADEVNIAISTMTHASALLTINTNVPHGLVAGKRFQISQCLDNRFNYPALVVASTPSPTQITATAAPNGNLPAITATATGGFLTTRPSLGYAGNGTAMILESPTTTAASFYIRNAEGDSSPSGTVAGNHTQAILTTNSIQAVNSPYTYSFQPTTEYRLLLQTDRIQWTNVAIDSLNQTANLISRTQVVPDSNRLYKLRIRATNAADLTRPVGKIITAVKAGTTTATITLDRDHGLAVGALVTVYGVRDFAATGFPNIVTATAITGVPATNQIQIVIGTGTANTSYGGYVSVVNGGNLPSALGSLAQVVQQATLSTLIDGTRQLTLVGSANWASPTVTVGDYVEVIGVRNNVNGADLGVDGAWKISSATTTSMTLAPIVPLTLPDDFAIVDCGGGLIRRTDLRISFVRIFDFDRERVELLARPTGDAAGAAPVSVQGTATVSGTVTAGAGSSLMGDVAQQYRTTASGASATHIVAAATTNAAIIKASAGKVLGWYLTNPTASWLYVKLHNLATLPVAGASVARTIGIPPNGVASFFSEGGMTFTTGIGVTIVTGALDADATAVTAASVVGEIVWA